MPQPPHQVHYFDEFALDLTRGSLRRGQEEVRLRPKSFDVLKYLVENSGRLINKDELIRAVWVGTAVTDDSLVQCLKDIRHALCDEAQRIIKTVRGRGYIFDQEVRDDGFARVTTYTEETAVVHVLIEEVEETDGRQSLEAATNGRGLGGDETRLEAATRVAPARPVTRLMVLPFRMLRPDPDVDFLAFSVPDAVAGALSVLDSVVVRSPTSAARYADESLDLNRIVEEAQAEVVLTGTILRAGDVIRVACQLLEAPGGNVLWWHEPQVSMSDLFELQDTLVRHIVASLSLTLSEREHQRLKRDVPSSATAYEFYLRGNELSRRGLAGFDDLTVARDLYRRSVEADPHYAPAWAQLGRCYRLIGKGMEHGRENLALAEAAFRRALELNADLPLAHSQYAFLEAELGRAPDAVARLLRCVQTDGNSPELFVALVLCCRFCGLLEASVAAHERARRLDPLIATSVSHTYYQLGDYDSALRDVAVGAWAIVGMTLGTVGRAAEGVSAFRKVEQSGAPTPMQAFVAAWRAMLEGNRQESLDAAERCIRHYLDPEGVFYMGLIMAHLGESERALTVLDECSERGFSSAHVLLRNPWLDGLRSRAQFQELLKRAQSRLVEAEEIYRAVGGSQVLDGWHPSRNARSLPLAEDKEQRASSALEFVAPLRRIKGVTPHGPFDLAWAGKGASLERTGEAFVGREPELKRLAELLRQASADSGRLVFITGESGIGKTTLADEFVRRARKTHPGLFLARGRCVEQYGTGEAYLPFLDALGVLLTAPGWERITAVLQTYAPTWCMQLPAPFFSSRDMERLQRETLGATKERMLREMGDALGVLAASAPMMILLEDLHWADPSSADLLQHLSKRIADQCLLIVGTLRPEDLATSAHPLKNYKLEMQGRNLCEEVALGSLSAEHLAAYLNARFAPNNFPTELPALIHRKTEGHPLFATSLVQFLADAGDIVRVNEHWALARPLAEMDFVAPESVRSVIRRKIESLAEEDKRALQYASIEGEEFTSTVVAKLMETDDLTLEERFDRLDKVHRLIQVLAEEELPDGTLTVRYRFAHALFQDVLYSDLVTKRRLLLHLRAGEQLIAHYGEHAPRIATQLAMHFERGRDFSRAIEYLTQAGDNAIKLSANAEAERHFSRALGFVEKLPAAEQFAAASALYHKRGRANLALTRLPQAEDDFTRLLDLARGVGAAALECAALNALADTFFYTHRLGEMRACAREAMQVAARTGDDGLRIEAMVLLGMTYTGSGELTEGIRLLDAAILGARGLKPSPALVRGLIYRGTMHYFQTEYDRAEALLTEAVSLASELRDGFMLLHSRFFLGLNLGNQGRMSEALAMLRDVMEMARRDGDHIILGRVPNSLGWIHRELGDIAQALALDEEGAEIARRYHVIEAEANSLINLSQDHTQQHDGERALAALNDAESIFEREQWNHWRFHHIRFHAGVAEHCLSQGELASASEHARKLLENATRHEVPKYVAVAHKLLAEIARARGNLSEAEAELKAALAQFETHPAPLLAWKVYAALGRLRLQLCHDQSAREAFAQAADIIGRIAAEVSDESLRSVFLNSEAVREVLAGAVGSNSTSPPFHREED